MKSLGVLVLAIAFATGIYAVRSASAGGGDNLVVGAVSASGELAAAGVEVGDDCAEALSALLNAKAKIRYFAAEGGAVTYSLDARKDVAILVCAPPV